MNSSILAFYDVQRRQKYKIKTWNSSTSTSLLRPGNYNYKVTITKRKRVEKGIIEELKITSMKKHTAGRWK